MDFLTQESGRGFWIVPYTIKTIQLSEGIEQEYGIPYNASRLAYPYETLVHADIHPIPDGNYAIPYKHYIPRDDSTNFIIGSEYLKTALELAENADYKFALRMQGLQNCSVHAVWCCVDEGYEKKNQDDMSRGFIDEYIKRFLHDREFTSNVTSAHVVTEAVQMYSDFTAEWGRTHIPTLAPVIESSGEALIELFMESSLAVFKPLNLRSSELFRAFRRMPELAPQLGMCLHFFMVKMEQDRGGRNANYKSMFNANTSNLLALHSMAKTFATKAHSLYKKIKQFKDDKGIFHTCLVDWYSIARQMPSERQVFPGFRSAVAGEPV